MQENSPYSNEKQHKTIFYVSRYSQNRIIFCNFLGYWIERRFGANGFTGRDVILLGDELFLLYSTTKEIHHKLEGETETIPFSDKQISGKAGLFFGNALIQIALLNIIFLLILF